MLIGRKRLYRTLKEKRIQVVKEKIKLTEEGDKTSTCVRRVNGFREKEEKTKTRL